MTDTTGSELRTSVSQGNGVGAYTRLRPAAWSELRGFADTDQRATLATFRAFCAARRRGVTALRQTAESGVSLSRACEAAARLESVPSIGRAHAFFTGLFVPWRVEPEAERGFLTGYYEPEVDGSLVPTSAFTSPILGRPDDLVSLPPGESFFPSEEFGVDQPLSAARRSAGGRLVPYPSRAEIESGTVADHSHALVWLRDAVEVFFVQVQGSARVRLPDGSRARLTYDGRNGHPYTSIGRLVVEGGHIPAGEMSLARLKDWLRAHPSLAEVILRRNRSYVFFKMLADTDTAAGPIGGAGTTLTPLVSIAVDRHLWTYGLPFWIDATLPWRSKRDEPFRRLMIAEDTGSAILGPARADIFFGTGEAAGARAGDIRHPGDFFVLLPIGAKPGDGR